MRRIALAALLAAALAGCGGGGGSEKTAATASQAPPATVTAPVTTAVAPVAVRVYRIGGDGKLEVRAAQVQPPAVAAGALRALGAGDAAVTLSGGVATVAGLDGADHARLAEVVYTLTQFPTIDAVSVGGRRLTRADFEDVTPAILVETPLPDATVSSPVRVAGTANTFEATFMLELQDAGGSQLSRQVVTATSGSGQRGTFDVSVPFTQSGRAKLVAYEASAEDGSPIHRVEVPVTLAP